MHISQGNASEALVLASYSDSKMMSRLLDLPLVKEPQFSLAVTLVIGSIHGTKLKAEDNFGQMPHIYKLWDDTSFHNELK